MNLNKYFLFSNIKGIFFETSLKIILASLTPNSMIVSFKLFLVVYFINSIKLFSCLSDLSVFHSES